MTPEQIRYRQLKRKEDSLDFWVKRGVESVEALLLGFWTPGEKLRINCSEMLGRSSPYWDSIEFRKALRKKLESDGWVVEWEPSLLVISEAKTVKTSFLSRFKRV